MVGDPAVDGPHGAGGGEGDSQDLTALYRHFDADGALLYVGITRDLANRWRQHVDKPWRALVVRTEVTWFATRRTALEAEARAVLSEDPTWNVAGHPEALMRGGKPGRRPLEDQELVRRKVRSARFTDDEVAAIEASGLSFRDFVLQALSRRPAAIDTPATP